VPGPTLRVLFLNTYLLRVIEAEVGRHRLTLASKPRVTERAEELGRALRGEYDVMALAEVFDERDLHSLLAAWPPGEAPLAHVGPVSTAATVFQTSGLVTLVDGPAAGRVAVQGFTTRGSRVHDADAWAEKGALFCEVTVDGVTVELTSTHLLAGGGLIPRPPWVRHAGDADRRAQVDELRAFVEQHHQPGNRQLVVGDFNLPATDAQGDETDASRELRDAFDHLDDLWCRVGDQGPGPTADIEEGTARFLTDTTDERFYLDAPAGESDAAATASRSDRIDYAFGSPDLEVVEFRRRRLPRPDDAAGLGEMDLMSDHVGLHLVLRVTSEP